MGMAMLSDFRFSQASLQDFQDCKRRFFYRYVQKLSWPALEAEPALENEQWLRQGAEFHQIVHQYFLGLPVEKLSELAMGENLRTWWENFLTHMPIASPLKLFPERIFTTNLAGYTLLAKFDLLVVDKENGLVIYDWKTSQRPGSRSFLASRMQSKVYPYVVAKTGGVFIEEGVVGPDKIKMIYWYPNRPAEPEAFIYSKNQMVEDEQTILATIEEINSITERSDHSMTEDRIRCRFCVYRSLCDRGDRAGFFEESELDVSPMLEEMMDFDQIPEIEF
jgi:hypothetical protein